MRIPTTGQPLYERRIVREGKRIADHMLNGYRVTANGRFVREDAGRNGLAAWLDGLASAVQHLGQRASRAFK